MYNFLITLKNTLRRLKKSNFKFHENYFKNLNNYENFKKIYDEKIWTPENKKKEYQYYSGLWSHDSVFATNYINKVKKSFDVYKISSNKIKGILKTTVLEIDSLYKN